MADHAEDGDNDIFIYRGGRASQHVTHALIDQSVNEIEDHAFQDCENLLTVETHNGIRRIGLYAFWGCKSLSRINLKSAVEIEQYAFYKCEDLESVEFGDRLDMIGHSAFDGCTSLKHLKLPSIITIEDYAFGSCKRLIDIELSERLEAFGDSAFCNCERLQRIVVPLKRDLFNFDEFDDDSLEDQLEHDNDFDQSYKNQFERCEQLTTVDIVGQAHTKKIIASLHMESWKTDMNEEINRINQVLPNTPADEKTAEIRQWMETVLDKMDHYKAEHHRYVKEGSTILELALWKAKFEEKEDFHHQSGWGSLVTCICGDWKTKKVKVDAESARKESRMLCGAEIVIKNVLPYLQLEE